MHHLSIRRGPSLTAIVAVLALAAALMASSAEAAYPGKNGKIAFLRGLAPSKVMTAKANGSHRKVVLNDDFYYPSFSASGRRLVVSGPEGIYLSRADGKHLVKVPHTNGPQSSPKLSPDGKTIAYVGAKGSKNALYTIRNDGTHKRVVAKGPYLDFDVAFSADGRYVITGFCSIRRITLRTGKVKSLYEPGPGEVCAKNPDVSPNGKNVVFEWSYEPENEIWKVGINGKNPHPLLRRNHLEVEDPVYSPDGKKLLFEGERDFSGKTRLMTASAKTGRRIHQLGSFTGYAPAWGPRVR